MNQKCAKKSASYTLVFKGGFSTFKHIGFQFLSVQQTQRIIDKSLQLSNLLMIVKQNKQGQDRIQTASRRGRPNFT